MPCPAGLAVNIELFINITLQGNSGEAMSDQIQHGAIKVIELVGISSETFDDAVQQAVKKASESLKNITGVEVVKFTAKVDGNAIKQYCANVKVAFVVQ